MNFLKELIHLFKFLTLPADKKNLLVYAEHRGYWPYFEGTVNELLTQGQTMVYMTSDPGDPVFRRKTESFIPIYSRQLFAFLFAFLKVKVVLMTMTDLNQLHARRSIHPVRYVYIFHSLVSSSMAYLEGAFDFYDVILCPSTYIRHEIEKRETDLPDLPKKTLVNAGYFRLERVYENFKAFKKKREGRTALIAPSWAKENVLEKIGEDLIAGFLAEGMNVIVRPHPEAVRRAPDLLRGFEDKFKSNPRFQLERTVETDDSLFEADVLISDWSGISFEYALGTERPVLFMDVPRKTRNPQFEELGITPMEITIREEWGLVSAVDAGEAIQKARTLLQNRDAYQEKLRAFRKDQIYAFGRSSQENARVIVEELK